MSEKVSIEVTRIEKLVSNPAPSHPVCLHCAFDSNFGKVCKSI